MCISGMRRVERKKRATLDVSTYFCGAVTVGAREQVVIPAGVRREKIGLGEKLLVFVHPAWIGSVLIPVEHASEVGKILRQFIEAEEG